jgi:hypothetical protein
LDEVLALEDFDAIVSPSDTFFYVRPLVDRARELGLPFVVVQKETTIAPATMVEHSRRLGRTFPFCSDRMFVCSERHKQFWVRAGADPELIDVLGQPRFDFYAQRDRWQRRPVATESGSNPLTVLYLSYMLNAYARPEDVDAGAPTWSQLREESEEALVAAAVQGRIRLLVKPHPQQRDLAELEARLADLAGPSYGGAVQLLSAADDVRPWIATSDVVVGFQTTALIEALAAGKRAVYTQWSEQLEMQRDRLIPFHEHTSLFHSVTSPSQLVGAVLASEPQSSDVASERDAFMVEHLGPIDGCSSRRVIDGLRAVIDSYPTLTTEQRVERARLGDWAVGFLRRARLRALARWVGWGALSAVVTATSRVLGRVRSRPQLADRVQTERRRLAECSGRRRIDDGVVGETPALHRVALRVLRSRGRNHRRR